ncbi:dienelactone hydrolase family protein [Polyangium jinanense]|uniref:Dienelactone hydrolase family protein n=1 Tax=Polyangium jinanense TaxID=2829994 RepID=A0A9X3X7L5_9BACT|nr:dienelactone hydrolase family protein [Polyangium jinanense]MDC3959283.1 dienelactone hydrolase family protein [Polyangium jinanense]MDC3985692.1 dienelactone hydrolase family protein [Polyangium jinanense]
MRFDHFLRSARALAVGLSVFALAACGGAPSPDAESPAPANTTPATAQTTSPAEGMLGTLSEEGFKALHQLKAEKAPAPRGERVTIDGTSAYLSLPKGKTAPLPGLVVIHEWWGLNEHIQHWTDRLAEDGYAAIAVDLYGGKTAQNPDDAMAMMKAVDNKKAMATLVAAHDFLEKDPRIQAKRTGVIGWCFGGAWSLQFAMHEPDLDASVIYYGHLVTDPAELKPIKAEILGIFGNKDQAIPPETVNAFDAALTQAGVTHTIYRYDAQHGFANPSGQRYDEKSAADAWDKVRPFLRRKLAQ